MGINKLPTEFKWCEGCKHFEALAYGSVLKCRKLGLVFDGMVICTKRKEIKHGANGKPSTYNSVRSSSDDSIRR